MSASSYKIVLNLACCLGCRQVLLSASVHDSRQCSCPNETHVDGGRDYLKRGGKDMSLLEEMSIVLHDGVFRKLTDIEAVSSVMTR